MSSQEILYVAYQDESLDDGIQYAIYLSGLLGESLSVVLLNRKGIAKRLDNLMSAVTFAEANEPQTGRELLDGGDDTEKTASIHSYVLQKCESQKIKATVHIGLEATVAVVMSFLKQKRVDLVLLSPAVTNSRSILNKLVKLSPRPVVTMARGASYSQAQAQ